MQTRPANTSTTTTITTQLPGMNNVQIIVSLPQLIKENSQHSSSIKRNHKKTNL
jgi:hypothetical protein